MRTLLTTLFLSVSLLSMAQAPLKHDSATIIFKNVTKATFKSVHAAIKGQLMFVDDLKPGKEYQHKICTNCYGVSENKTSEYPPNTMQINDTLVYRFTVTFMYGSELWIEPQDYAAQVSKENITSGIYIYYIGVVTGGEDAFLSIKLKKLK